MSTKEESPQKTKFKKAPPLLLFFGFLSAIGGGVIGVIIGSTLHTKQVRLSDGSTSFKYTEKHRDYGRQMANIGAVMFYIGLFLQLFD